MLRKAEKRVYYGWKLKVKIDVLLKNFGETTTIDDSVSTGVYLSQKGATLP